MLLLARISVGYLVLGALVVLAWRDEPATLLGKLILKLPASFAFFVQVAWWVLPLAGLSVLLIPAGMRVQRLSRAVVAVVLSTMFFLTFTMIKNSLPHIQPCWADPMLARIDQALHLGA